MERTTLLTHEYAHEQYDNFSVFNEQKRFGLAAI